MAYDAWGGSWGTSWALTWTGEHSGTPTPPEEVSQASGVKRRRRRYVIELDGQPVVVGSIAEARELLSSVRERVREEAQVSVSKSVRIKPGRLIPKVIARTPDKAIRRVVKDAQADYDRIIRAAIAKAVAEEDELIVLLGV